MVDFSEYGVTFVSNAMEPGDFFVRKMVSRDAISHLYEVELDVHCLFEGALTADQVKAMLVQTAYVQFGDEDAHRIHGVLRSVQQLSPRQQPGQAEQVWSYRLVMVPRLFYSTMTFRSRVYQPPDEGTVRQIVKAVLEQQGMKEKEHFEFRLVGDYPEREYVVQYEESDFNFISRWMEHYGIFYFWEHDDEVGDKLIIGDSNEAFRELAQHEIIGFDPRAGTSVIEEAIHVLSWQQQIVESHVYLRDYNWRTPSVSLAVDEPVDSDIGRGDQVFYGEHYKDVTYGRKIAQYRSQEMLAQMHTYRGRSSVRGLRPGHKFELENFPLGDMDQKYIITEMTHSVTQGQDQSEGYHNQFTAVPYGVTYRPVRKTRLPKIEGFMHCKVDGEQPGTAAPIDDQGRYKLLMPYDTIGTPGGKASRWTRMAQTFSGAGYGMHFPLHIGIECIVSHLDGDPDRPIIVGSVPNPETSTPVIQDNATQSAIRTRSGIHIEFEDDA